MNQKRKYLLIQIAALAVICLLIAAAGRILAGNRFEMAIPPSQLLPHESADEIQIEWENGQAMEVLDISIEKDGAVHIILRPDAPGDYALNVKDTGGAVLLYDELHVDALGTTYSMQSRNYTGDNAVLGATALFFVGLAVLSLLHFKNLTGPMLYSYDAIWSMGLGVFCSVAGLNLLIIFIRRIAHDGELWMRFIYETFSLSGWIFMLVTSPAMLVFSLLMIISNIELLRHERVRVQNILGLGIGAAIISCEAFGAWLLMHDVSGSQMQVRIYYTLSSVYYTTFTYFECILIGSVVCGLRAAGHIPEPLQDYIMILGCGFRKDGTLPPLLRGRVDKAIEYWKMQKEKFGKEAVLIPSGGQGGNEPMPEAEAMGRYLLECGIPEEVILKEDKSRNTYQNMAFSKKLIEEREGGANDKKVIFVTTNYHVFRSGVWAGLADLSAEGLGSKTKWWFWPNAFIRECIGLLANRIAVEVVCLVLLVLLFGGIATLVV